MAGAPLATLTNTEFFMALKTAPARMDAWAAWEYTLVLYALGNPPGVVRNTHLRNGWHGDQPLM
jgi:hypothetical protein